MAMACHGFWMLLAWGFASENQNLGFEPLKNGNSPGFRSPPISFFLLGSVKNSEWGFHRAKAGIGSSQNHQTNEISPDLDYWM